MAMLTFLWTILTTVNEQKTANHNRNPPLLFVGFLLNKHFTLNTFLLLYNSKISKQGSPEPRQAKHAFPQKRYIRHLATSPPRHITVTMIFYHPLSLLSLAEHLLDGGAMIG